MSIIKRICLIALCMVLCACSPEATGQPSTGDPDNAETLYTWITRNGDPANALDKAILELPQAAGAFYTEYPSSPAYQWPFLQFGDIQDSPYAIVARVSLQELPRLFGYLQKGLDASQLLWESFQFMITRIDQDQMAIDKTFDTNDISKLYKDPYLMEPAILFSHKVSIAPQFLGSLADSNLMEAAKEELLSRFGIAGLPFLCEKIITEGDDRYLAYAHAALPYRLVLRERDNGLAINGETDLERIRSLLSECSEDVEGVRVVGTTDYLAALV